MDQQKKAATNISTSIQESAKTMQVVNDDLNRVLDDAAHVGETSKEVLDVTYSLADEQYSMK